MFVNPAAGGGEGIKLFNRVARAMRDDPSVQDAVGALALTPEREEDVPAAVELLKRHPVALVCGGDGTVHRMAGLILRHNTGGALAVYPIGTGNDFAIYRRARKSGVVERIRKIARSSETSAVDVYTLNGSVHFVNYAGFGLDAWILSLYAVAIKHLGRLWLFHPNIVRKGLFALVGVWALLFHRISVTTAEGKCLGVIACNLPYYAGGSLFSKEAAADDGKIELLRIADKKAFVRLVFSRFHGGLSEGAPAFAPPVRLSFSTPPPVQVDGEDYTRHFAACREFAITHAGKINVAD